MRAFAWSKNKKGAALIYAVMVLLFLSTLIIAITAISSASYADAVLSVSDDQSYYYAKSIGLAIKEQFKDGYNLDKIITTLDKDGMVSGTFNVSSDDGDMVNGNVQIRYVEDDEGNVNKNIIEVRAACLVNNAISVVTSIYSCEDDSDNEITHMDGALSDYDVILTDPSSATFDFAQASEKWTGTNDLSIYVYAGEDDSVTNPEFKLCVDLDGKLTTTGATKIKSVTSSTNSTLKTHKITGNLTSYGNMTLQYTSVDGMNGIHAKGDVTLQAKSYVKYDIFAKGAVTLENPGEDLHWYYTAFDGSNGYSSSTAPVNHQARNIYAQEKVTLNARAYVSGNILTHGDVELIGKGASAGSTGSAMHFANTCVGGNIYADGDVKIRNGAIVLGSVYAKGNVTIENGASVVGDVQSVSGNIKVLGGAVGGQVNCPNGLLELSNKEKDTYCTYLSEFDFSGTGRTLFGGIGLNHPAGVTYNHTCKQLKTADCECMSVVRGNLYVETATKDGVTYFNSIWCCDGKVYLKDSFAGFIDGSRSCVGANEAGNAYTYIEELNQKADFYDKKNYANNKNPYLNMAGAHIVTLNVGENHARLRDAYCWNGWITNLNARCAYLADVRFGEEVVVEGVRYILGGKIYAAQYVHIWGTGSAASYNLDNYKKTGRPGGVYPYAAAGVTSLLASGITIEVACRTLPSYEGNFLSETNCGFRLGTNAMIDTGTTVYVGSTWSGSSSSLNAYVILGENGAVDTKFYGTLHACVGSFKVGGKTRLSTRRTVNDTAALSAATIYAEITGAENANYANTGIRPAAAAGHFYVEKTATSPHYRYGSKVEVKGNVYLAGELYDFTHFERDGGARFFNKNDGKIRGTLVTTASAVNLTGTNDNFYKVEATNSSATVTLTGALYVYGFKVNGILDTKGYELQVKQGTNALTKDSEGDFYVEKLKTNDIGNVSVARDATINNLQNNSGTLTASTKFFVGRDLTLNHGSIKLDKNGSGVGRILKVSSGNAEIGSGNASHTLKLGSADVNGNLKIAAGCAFVGYIDKNSYGTEYGTGKILCKNFEMSGGNLKVGVKDSAGSTKTGRISCYIDGTYLHTGGSITMADITVTSSSNEAVTIRGTAIASSIYIFATKGGAAISGGASIYYSNGNLSAQKSISIKGWFECGASAKGSGASITIGEAGETGSEYKVGWGVSGDDESDSWCVIYADQNVIWQGKAISAHTGTIMYAHPVSVNAKNGYVRLGSASNYIKGFFNRITAENGYVEAYADTIDGVLAKTWAKVYVTTKIGLGYYSDSGICVKDTGGTINVGGKTASATLYGLNNVENGTFTFDTKMQTDARIKCRAIKNLENASYAKEAGINLLHLSLYLTAPTLAGDGYYYLEGFSFTKTENGTAGDFTISGNLAYAYPVRVEGELYVDGTFKYKGNGASEYSLTDLVSLGGLHCLNSDVTIKSDFHGRVDLPNVTTLSLNGLSSDVSLNIPKFTGALELKYRIEGSLKLESCTSFTVAAGASIGGNLTIKSDGKVVNNGAIGESVKCGYYEGSGTVGKDLILNSSDKTSKITGTGYVAGKIWTPGTLEINSTGTFCSNSGAYVYSAKNITITGATFNTSVSSYILSTGGDILLTNCINLPKVWNTSGFIRFKNDSSHKATIKSILSYGTFIDFGTSGSDDYQTVTGKVEWNGNHNGDGALDFYNGTHTYIKGDLVAIGKGGIRFRNAQLTNVYLYNDGKVTSESGAKAKTLTVNSSSTKRVKNMSFLGTVEGKVVLFGDSTTEMTLGTLSGTEGYVHAYGGSKLTVNGKISQYFWSKDITNVVLKGEVAGYISENSASVEVQGGTLQTENTIAKRILAYNANLKILGNVGADLWHSAPNNSSASTMKVVELGSRDKQITIAGGIIAHGRVVDSSKQTVENHIWVKGAYYTEYKKDFTNCQGLWFTSEASGSCTILGSPTGNKTINTPINVQGRLVVLTFYKDSTYYQLFFKQTVIANALVSNSEMDGTGNIDYVCASNILRSDDPLEPLTTCPLTYNIWLNKRKYNQCTSKDRVQFHKPVYLTAAKVGGVNYYGTCHASNTAFKNNDLGDMTGSTLFTEGQVSLNYCYFESQSYKSTTNHCFSQDLGNNWKTFIWYQTGISNRYYTNGIDKFSIDGSMFVHSSSSTGGANYFRNVQTKSNLSVYNGVTYMVDTELEGCMVETQKNINGDNMSCHIGHTSTKLYYFGDSLYMRNSHVRTNMNEDTDIPSGRTILWVEKGALVLDSTSYIGDQFYGSRPGKGTLNTNKQSFHPGVFVSDSSGSNVTFSFKRRTGTDTDSTKKYETYSDSTTYNKGYCEVKGSVTLDILAYKGIRVHSDGVVTEKGNNDSGSKAYKAGLYVTTGSITNNGFFGLFSAESGSRHYETGVAKTVNKFKPYTPDYAEYVRLEFTPSDKTTMGIWYTWSYTPANTINVWIDPTGGFYQAPVGVNVNPYYPTWMCGRGYVEACPVFTDQSDSDPSYSIAAKPSAPTKPSIADSATSNPFNVSVGSGAMQPLDVENDCAPEGPVKMSAQSSSHPSTTVVAKANTNVTFGRVDAWTSYSGWNSSYEPTEISNHSTTPKRPSTLWTADITRHFDTDNPEVAYWNTRFIPYTWKLPYTNSDGVATPAKRVLQGKTFDDADKYNGEFDLTGWTEKEASGSVYYVNSEHYSGSHLANAASMINTCRSTGISGGRLWDWIAFNGYDEHTSWYEYEFYDHDHDRRKSLFVFESGELPYEAFYMNTKDDQLGAGSYNITLNGSTQSLRKKIRGSDQVGWWWGSDTLYYYDVSLVFYTCTDPTNPFGSEAKDLHVVLPQGIAMRFLSNPDVHTIKNTVTVVGKGRVFLYVTTGDTLYFQADATRDDESGFLWWKETKTSAVYANPVGGLKKVSNTKYEPLLYIIGAGTNIDIVLENMPLAAMVYMPFGYETSLYDGSSGEYKKYNQFKSMANNASFSTTFYSGTGTTTSVRRNRLILKWDNTPTDLTLPRWMYGQIVTDNLIYSSASNAYNLSFKNQYVKPNLSETTIYDYSTTSNKKRGGKTYSLAQFLSAGPGFSNKLLQWDYKGIRLDG